MVAISAAGFRGTRKLGETLVHVAVQRMYCSILLGAGKAHISDKGLWGDIQLGGEDPHQAVIRVSCLSLIFEGKPSCKGDGRGTVLDMPIPQILIQLYQWFLDDPRSIRVQITCR